MQTLPAKPPPVQVILADDDQATLAACRAALIHLFGEGVRVHEARTPEEALELLRETQPHLVLVDYWFFLSPLTGIDLLEATARERPEALRILMTGYPGAPMAFEATRRARVHGYIAKPAPLQAIEHALGGLLGRGR